MKILSKYKDYYDYLTGVWGEDPKLVLDRREYDAVELVENAVYYVYVGNFIIEGFCKNGIIYYGEKLREIETVEEYYSKKKEYQNKAMILTPCEYSRSYKGRRYGGTRYNTKWVKTTITEGTGKLTTKEECPIIVQQESPNTSSIVKTYRYPKLEEIGLPSFIDATDVYRMIADWLAKRVDETELTTSTTNEQKIENKGFDTKTSFRPNMK
jgi:hypothetical protein